MSEYIERGAALDKCGWYNTVNGKSICAARKDELVAIPAADVVELPCKIGDVVWTYLRTWRHEDGIVPYQITNLTITQNKKGLWTKKYRAMWLVDGKTRDWSKDFAFDEIGKRVFLSQEEAERELMRGGAIMDGGKDNG